MRYQFEDIVLDPDRRELARGSETITPGSQVFDLLVHLVRNREQIRSWLPSNLRIAPSTVDEWIGDVAAELPTR